MNERESVIFQQRMGGWSLARIADRHQLSAERVRQILAKGMRQFFRADKQWKKAEEQCRIMAAGTKDLVRRIVQLEAVVGTMAQIAPEEMRPMGWERMTIDDLELPSRPYNCLTYARVETVAQMCKLSANDFLRMKNFGRRSLRDVRCELERVGAPHRLDENRRSLAMCNTDHFSLASGTKGAYEVVGQTSGACNLGSLQCAGRNGPPLPRVAHPQQPREG